VQTQYAAEAALSTTLAWVDGTSLSGTFYSSQLKTWADAAAAPTMRFFGEPEIAVGNRAWANRTRWEQQRLFLPTYETAPLTVAGGVVASPSTAQPVDEIGSFGPRTAYLPGFQSTAQTAAPLMVDYVVDMYDCQQLPVTATPGSQINQTGSGVPQQLQFYCVITARGRSYLPGAATKVWTLAGANTYAASRFSAAHDARGSLITPPILQ